MKHSSRIELPPVLAQHLPIIQALCRKHQVKQLWAFGSVLREDFGEHSDINLLYTMDDALIQEEDWYDSFWGFLDEMEALLGHKLDFIWYQGIKNPYFREEVNATKVVLYEQTGEKITL
ncbi:MAG: nucleotidyltransferase domain-containing protein [Bacteroidota bacterium]